MNSLVGLTVKNSPRFVGEHKIRDGILEIAAADSNFAHTRHPAVCVGTVSTVCRDDLKTTVQASVMTRGVNVPLTLLCLSQINKVHNSSNVHDKITQFLKW
jgi:hypothetical protein